MAVESDPWLERLEDSTRSAGTAAFRPDSPTFVPGLTLLCHPDPGRVGERVALSGLLSGQAQELSRTAPRFAPPQGGTPRPLADDRLSRSPLWIRSESDGEIVLDAGQSRTPVTADGEPVEGLRSFTREQVQRGVVLLLASRVVLVLHAMEPLGPPDPSFGLVGESRVLADLRRDIQKVADGTYPVLLRGESGTGKELVARAVHDAGPRRDGPYLAVNLGGVSPSLAAADLFGASRGAFTGADRRRPGYFQRASGGTLFLDEVGEASAEVQVLLLRALETGRVQPVGGGEDVEVDVRVVAATDADLEAMTEAGEMRLPLFHRLSSYEITLPPLRALREDLGRLFFHFLRLEMAELGEEPLHDPGPDGSSPVDAGMVARLALHDWPGNVRELRNVARQLAVANRGSRAIRPVPRIERLLTPTASAGEAEPTREEAAQPSPRARYRAPSEVDEAELRAALRACRFEPTPAARRLNVSRSTLYDLMKTFGVRNASEIDRDEIEACLKRCQGDTEAMAETLEISQRGLLLRMNELGLR